jgi:TetR/AcrR family transcriptional repressor of nem operon
MRRSREDKAKTHEAIVAAAAEQIRARGLDGPGVAELMRAAGLTHGGFYKHFGSRGELLAEASERAYAAGDARLAARMEGAADAYAALVANYLSPEHRDDRGTGCGLAALGADVARNGDETLHALYRDQIRRYVTQVTELTGDREQALLAVSAMVGALVLARGAGEDPLSGELLETVAARLLGR